VALPPAIKSVRFANVPLNASDFLG